MLILLIDVLCCVLAPFVDLWADTGGIVVLRRTIPTTSKRLADLRCLSFSPNGQMVATGGSEGIVRIWDIKTRNKLGEMRLHRDGLLSVAFSPDGRLLAAGSYDCTVTLWNTRQRKLLFRLRGHEEAVTATAFSPNGNYLATASADNTVKLWSAKTGKLGKTLRGHKASVVALVFMPDHKKLISAGCDKRIRIWELSSGKQVGRKRPANHVEFDPTPKTNGVGPRTPEIRRLTPCSCCLLWVYPAPTAAAGESRPRRSNHLSGSQSSSCSPVGVSPRAYSPGNASRK